MKTVLQVKKMGLKYEQNTQLPPHSDSIKVL